MTTSFLLESEKVESRGTSKKTSVLAFICLLLLKLGILLVIFGSLNLEEEKDERRVDRLGVVIDAGGSGTRLILYSFANGTFKQLKYRKCEGTGLAKYPKTQFAELKNKLSACLADGAKGLPTHKEVPIYFAATAGMRLLRHTDRATYDTVWNVIKETLQESPFKMKRADTITGFEEAMWAWVSANYLKNTLQTQLPRVGTIDFGSSSLQLAFNLDDTAKETGNVKKIDIDGKEIMLYGHSYLCYGNVEMNRRLFAKIVKDANYTNVVKNPCYQTGFSKNFTSDYLWKAPCSSGSYAKDYLGEEIKGPMGETYLLEGTSDFDKCYETLQKTIMIKCTKGSCGMNDEFQPAVKGRYLALSTFYYFNKLVKMNENSTITDFYKAAEDLCSLTWQQMGDKYEDKYLDSRCFQAAYGYYMFNDGFKFDDNTWKVDFVGEIGGTKVGWSLGLIYSHKTEMFSRIVHAIRVVQNSGFVAMLVIGVLVILASICVGVVAYKGRNKSTTSSKNSDPNV